MEDDRAMDHLLDIKRRLGKLEVHDPDQDAFDGVGDDDYFDEEDEDDSRFINLALLSHIAVRLRDKVPRATHVKGSIPYPRAFTGKDIVVRSEFTYTSAQAATDPTSQSPRSSPLFRERFL